MTSCRRTLSGSPLLALPVDQLRSKHIETGAVGTRTHASHETAHPTTLRALLLLSGAAQPTDASLTRTTDTELLLLQETMDLLNRIEAASAA